MKYDPSCFDVANIAKAKEIILTPEQMSTEERWEKETPYLADLAIQELELVPGLIVLDYGCGIGRLSKALINEANVTVIGVDISPSMRALSHMYVNSPNFMSVSPEGLDKLIEHGIRFDAALAVWVLQHCLSPETELERLHSAMATYARLLVVNNKNNRAVPTDKGWADDKKEIQKLTWEMFDDELATGELEMYPKGHVLRGHAYWSTYERR